MAIVERGRRVPLDLGVRVRIADPRSSFIEDTHSLNVGGRGICFESRQKLQVGTRVELAIELPRPLRRHFGNRAVYRVRAVVCRVERLGRDSPARVGARFLGEIRAGKRVV
jgi:hypothetical protein